MLCSLTLKFHKQGHVTLLRHTKSACKLWVRIMNAKLGLMQFSNLLDLEYLKGDDRYHMQLTNIPRKA